MPTPQSDLDLIRMLSERLERISADSVWAHRASGLRGSLLRLLEDGNEEHFPDPAAIAEALDSAFRILEGAARRK